MWHVPLNVQVLILIAWGRYICLKKKTHCHHFVYEPLCLMELKVTRKSFTELIAEHI